MVRENLFLHSLRMKKILFASTLSLIIPFSISITYASSIPSSREDYCARFDDNNESKISIQDLSNDEVNRLSMHNNGGLFNGGVCWWHSRFQRNVLYLGIFKPDLPKLATNYELATLIHKIRLGQSIVIIPGYENFEEFTQDFTVQKYLQNELNQWQIYDGVVLGAWIDGLKGSPTVDPTLLSTMMDDLFDYVSVQKKIGFLKLQLKGITSHAWLAVAMKEMPSGYDIGYIDSNYPLMTKSYSYKQGDNSFEVSGYGNFTPYLEYKHEEERLVNVGKSFCGLASQSFAGEKMQSTKQDERLDALSLRSSN